MTDSGLHVGASEVAAVMGVDPRRTTFQYWLEKLGLVERMPETYRMRRGKFLEKLLIEGEYPALTGYKSLYWDRSETDPERPYMRVTADGFRVDRNRGIEAKVVSWDQAHLWNQGPPMHVVLQCDYSMDFYGFDSWDIIAAIADDEPEVWTVNRDDELIKVVRATVGEFWARNLINQEQPPIDGTAAAAIYLQRKFSRYRQRDIRPATEKEVALLEEYAGVRATFFDAKKKRTKLEAQLKEAVGEAEGIAWQNGKFTWCRTRDGRWMDWESMAIALRTNFIKDEVERVTLTESYWRPKPGMRKIAFKHSGAAVDESETEEAA